MRQRGEQQETGESSGAQATALEGQRAAARELPYAQPVVDELSSAPGANSAERCVALLGDPRLSHRTGAAQRARLIQQLQRTHGNAHVQRILSRVQRKTDEDAPIAQRSGLPAEAEVLEGAPAGGRSAPGIVRAERGMIQLWNAPAHLALGNRFGGSGRYLKLAAHERDLPQHSEPVETWPATWQFRYHMGTSKQKRMLTQGMSYGEILALGGDLYPNFEAMNNAPLHELYRLVEMVNRPQEPGTEEFQEATGGRYLALARENAAHFRMSKGTNSLTSYVDMHRQALEAAMTGKADRAYAMNAVADHFLTDSFAGAHLRVPRSEMPGSMGGIRSKVEHDLDGMFGVDVHNARGDRWIAYGETLGDLEDPRNGPTLRIVAEALALSAREIDSALHRTQQYKMPAVFAAAKLVPRPVDPTAKRWPEFMFYVRLRSLIGEEAPGIFAGFFNDDDQVREWIGRTPKPALAAQPVDQKVRMIKTLLSGWISDDDVEAIEALGRAIPGSERRTVWDQVQGDVGGMFSGRQRRRVVAALRPAGLQERAAPTPSERRYGPYGVPKIGSNI